MVTECFYCIHVYHFFKICIIPCFDFLNFVWSTETVEEVDECNFAFESCKVCNRSKVHNFLWVWFSEHCSTCLTAGINVWMITEDVQRLCSNTACSNMEYTRKLFSSNLVHVRNHQEKTLWSCKCSSKCTRCKWTVNCTCGTGFWFHFDNLYLVTEDVFLTTCRPVINPVSHWWWRSDWINTGNFCKGISNVCGSLVTIHRLFLSGHFVLLYRKSIQKKTHENLRFP